MQPNNNLRDISRQIALSRVIVYIDYKGLIVETRKNIKIDCFSKTIGFSDHQERN